MAQDNTVLYGVVAYLSATLIVGYLAGRKVKDGEDFMVAGRSLPTWLCTFTVFATWFGAGTCLGAAGAAYKRGFRGIIADPFGAVLCLLLAGTFFFKTMRRLRFITVGDFFRVRYGETVEVLACVCMVPIYIGWVASQLVAFGYILKMVTGLAIAPAILLGTIVVLVYTAAGGMWAVAFTDFFQAIVLIAGLLVLLPSVWSAAGGWTAITEKLPAGHLQLTPDGGLIAWMFYIQAWLILGIGDLSGQELMGRAMSAKDENVAQRSAYLAAFLYLTIGLVPVILGMIGSLLLPTIGDPEYILLELGRQYLSPLALALFTGALVSALMSSADSALLAQASLVVENILPKCIGEMDSDKALRACRTVVLTSGLLSLGVALYLQNIYELMLSASAIGLVSIAVPFIAGIYWPRANMPGAIAAMFSGLCSWIFFTALGKQIAPNGDFPSYLLAVLCALIFLVVTSKLTAQKWPANTLVPNLTAESLTSGE